MRQLTSHKINGLNDAITINVTDEPGAGGANHEYIIVLNNGTTLHEPGVQAHISFQNGPIKEAGFNGLSNEALLAVVEDRLKSFQHGTFSCLENSLALTHLQIAMIWLHKRTRDRMSRGVEGTHQP